MVFKIGWIQGALMGSLLFGASQTSMGMERGMETGMASFYGAGEALNEQTAANIPFDSRLMECASWRYPLGSVLEVTSLATGKTVVVRCTDRGPSKQLNRLIDLTYHAFASIEDPEKGLTPVRIRRLK